MGANACSKFDMRSLKFLRGAMGAQLKNSMGCIGAHLELFFRAARGAPQIFLWGGTGRKLILRPDTPQKKRCMLKPREKIGNKPLPLSNILFRINKILFNVL